MLIVGIIIVAAILGVGIFFALRGAISGSNQAGGGTGTLPPVATGTSPIANGTSSFPTGTTFQIGTDQGGVTVNNFYTTMDYITKDNETVVLAENDTFTIDYDRNDSGFIIALISVPGSLQDARTAAETVFLQQLGVSQSDACKLNVDERVIDKTSPYDGQLMGLSFCPSTIPQ